MSQTRQPKGVPVGGQYAENQHDEATSALSPGGSADALSPRGFITDDQIDDVRRALTDFRLGDDDAWRIAGDALGADDPDDPYLQEVSAAFDDAHDENGVFDSGAFYDDVRSLSVTYRGWNQDTFEEPAFGARADDAKGKSTVEVNKMLRSEFKSAQASGYLPEGITVKVTKSPAGEPRVEYSGVPAEFRHRPLYPGETSLDTPERMRETPEYKELDRRIRAVANTFAVDETDRNSHDPVLITRNMPIVVDDRWS